MQTSGRIQCPVFVYTQLLEREPEIENCILWRDLSFFRNLFLLLFVSYMTQYKHANPLFDQLECCSAFHKDLYIGIFPLMDTLSTQGKKRKKRQD